jgi:hypothetical protein
MAAKTVAAKEIDVPALVEQYAGATADVTFSVCSRTNKLPRAGEAFLKLPPAAQAQAVMLLMQRLAAARKTESGRISWNYLSVRPPYAGMTALLHTLLRKKLPFDEPQLIALVQHTADIRNNDSYDAAEPTAAVVKQVEQSLGGQFPVDKLRRQLKRLERMLEISSNDKKPKLALIKLLGE